MRAFAVALLAFAASAVPAFAEDPPDAPAAPADNENRGRLGYSAALIESLDPAAKKELGIDREHGLYVQSVVLGNPAMKAGLKAGDVLKTVNGKEIPDTSKVDVKDEKAVEKYLKEEFGKITNAVRPGDKVELVVDRKGRTETIVAVAITKAQAETLLNEALEDEQAVKIPDPAKAGPANAAAFGFEGLGDKERPDEFLNVTGWWDVSEEEGKADNHVLRQHSDMEAPWGLAFVTGDGRAYADGKASVRWTALGGMRGVGGAIVFRATTRKDFTAVVVDGVSKTLKIVVVEKGKARALATFDIPSPKLRSWHTLEATWVGGKISGVYDGTVSVSAGDCPTGTGWAGLGTPEDADTAFDDAKFSPDAK